MAATTHLWIDGACSGNGTPNAVAAAACVVVECDASGGFVSKRTLTGPVPNEQTNNRGELQAAIIGLQAVDREIAVVIHTDSNYVMNIAINGWKPKTNFDLWAVFNDEAKDRSIQWDKVVGHSGVQYNVEADKSAQSATFVYRREREAQNG